MTYMKVTKGTIEALIRDVEERESNSKFFEGYNQGLLDAYRSILKCYGDYIEEDWD